MLAPNSIQTRPTKWYNGWAMMYIADWHQEYGLPEGEYDTRVERVYCGHSLSCLFEASDDEQQDENLGKIYEMLHPDIRKYMDDRNMTLWAIHGSCSSLARLLNKFIFTVFAHQTSGDDDTYDYWPNAVQMCRDIANDLDELAKELQPDLGPTYHIDLVHRAYKHHVATYGAVSEFFWDYDNQSFENAHNKEQP